MSSGGANRGQGAKNGVVRTMLIDSGMHTKIVEQLNEMLDNNELEAKDLLSLLSFFVPKLKAIEIETPQENNIPTFNFEILTDDEKLQYHRITSKLLEDEL